MFGNRQMNMCDGSLWRKIFVFALPLFFSNILQLLFNAADLMVLGRYAPHEDMAAVGASGALTGLIASVFIGVSMGANVLAARYFGGKDRLKVRTTVETAMATAVYGGFLMVIVGLLAAPPCLRWMGTPPNVLDKAVLYVRIIMLGAPIMMVYNYGYSVLRALGDTVRPFFFLALAGIINVLLNLLTVIVFKMGVAGVAVATVFSQAVSAVLVLNALLNNRGYHLNWHRLKFNRPVFAEMLKIGIPSGLQGGCFALSNMVVQSSVNSLGSYAVAGSAAAGSIEGIIWVMSFSFHMTAVPFAAQNLGGKKIDRVVKSLRICMFYSVVLCLLSGIPCAVYAKELVGFFNPDAQVVLWGARRLVILAFFYWVCALMDVSSGCLRGLGYSGTSAASSLAGVCGLRLLWIWLVFPHFRTMENLMWCYPLSWIAVAGFNYFLLKHIIRKISFRSRLHL